MRGFLFLTAALTSLEHMDVRVPVAPGAQTGLRRQKSFWFRRRTNNEEAPLARGFLLAVAPLNLDVTTPRFRRHPDTSGRRESGDLAM
jgi:hypothetical protein